MHWVKSSTSLCSTRRATRIRNQAVSVLRLPNSASALKRLGEDAGKSDRVPRVWTSVAQVSNLISQMPRPVTVKILPQWGEDRPQGTISIRFATWVCIELPVISRISSTSTWQETSTTLHLFPIYAETSNSLIQILIAASWQNLSHRLRRGARMRRRCLMAGNLCLQPTRRSNSWQINHRWEASSLKTLQKVRRI